MDDVVQITVVNAEAGLCLTPDMAFYASEIQRNNLHLHDAVIELHRTQLTATSFDGLTNAISDLYSTQHNTLSEQMVVCAAVASGYTAIRRWWTSAVQTAVSIHLNTIGAPDENRAYPRIIPHQLDDLRIATPEQINHDLLWRIVTIDPWLSYAERARAQRQRMETILSQPGKIEKLPELIDMLDRSLPNETIKQDHKDRKQQNTQRSIRRAFKLHDRLFGLDNLRQLRRQPLLMSGRLYNYSLSINRGDIFYYTQNLNTGTSPIHIAIQRKPDNTQLCTLCLYFTDTPIIDHLIAFTLYLKTAETELDMLRAGQVQNITSAFYNDPLLPELKGLLDPVHGPSTFVANLTAHVHTDHQYDALREHFMDQPWHYLAVEMMDYPVDLLIAMAYGERYSPWDFIDGSDRTAPILERVTQCFR